MQSATATPLADLLDAQVAAHHAGVSDADVAILMEIGEDIAAFGERIALKLARLTSGAIATNVCRPRAPKKHAFEMDARRVLPDLLLQTFDEDDYGYELDHKAVIAAACAARLAEPVARPSKYLTGAEASRLASALGLSNWQIDQDMVGLQTDEFDFQACGERMASGDHFARFIAGKRTSTAYRAMVTAYLRSRRHDIAKRLRAVAQVVDFDVIDHTGARPSFERAYDAAEDVQFAQAA